MELGTLIGAGMNLGAFSLVAWLVRHTFSHTIPRLAEQFQEMLTAQREAAITSSQSERAAYIEDAKAQRRDFLEELRRLSTEAAQERHDCLQKMEQLRAKVDDLADIVRGRRP